MNDQDFALLVEKYLEGSLSASERAALREAVADDPERARAFGRQVRQHVRLHAQTGRWDATESQRIALLVLDEAAKTESAPPPFLMAPSWRESLRAVLRGLRAGRASGARRHARYVLLRLFAPGTSSLVATAAILVLLALFVIPRRPTIPPEPPTVVILNPMRMPPSLDPLPRSLEPEPPAAEPEPGPEAPGVPNVPPEPLVAALPGPVRPEPVQPGVAPVAPAPERPISAALLPASLWGRTPEGRRRAAKLFQPDPRVDSVVLKTLAWLKAHQRPDGAWDGQDRVAMTGLAVLTFLAHGETTASREYGETVLRAIQFLLGVQTERGVLSADAYAHAIATYGLAEAFALTRVVALRQPLERAVQVIIDGQQPEGGFDYRYAQGPRYDTSVTGWQVQALKAAQLAGASNAGLEGALERAVVFLKTRSFAADGSGFVYSGQAGTRPASGATWTMTGVGTLCLQMAGQARTTEVKAGLRALEGLAFRWPAAPDVKAPVYGAYYVTQAKFQAGGQVWESWNRQCTDAFIRSQKADGHWEGGDHETGSQVYTTTLCALTLQVYCRYLPSYTRFDTPGATASSGVSNDVVVGLR